MARNLAERDRGLVLSSADVGRTGLRINNRTVGWCPHTHCGK